jgi:proline dehydrogenase
MSPVRGLLLAASSNRWLAEQATRRRFVRRAVSRFMPGERFDDALAAATALADQGIDTIVTQLGENITSPDEATAVVRHYEQVLDRLAASNLECEVSVKLTQLGLDLSRDLAVGHTRALAERAGALGRRLWIDMESSDYTDATLDVYRTLRGGGANVGVCLQAYLRRTKADLESLLPLAPAIRVVKGAYREPAAIAFASKAEVDASFFDLCRRLLEEPVRRTGAWLAAATHDVSLVRRIEDHAAAAGVPGDAWEYAMLYGIQRAEQARLAGQGRRVRVLISYGSHWFPWYMRRLAERPANVWFVVKNLFGG